MSTIPVDRLNAALEGRYTIERELGEGGMATVFLADDLKHERKVALKVLKPELAAVVGAERFLSEIKVTANLQHPNILPLFDSGEADSFLFYVMPYVEGESLRERLNREQQLHVDEAVKITTNLAEALDHAHRQGVVHRDIKPANILLRDGRPLIADFGIALAVGAAGGTRLTETGLSVGTPYYMSPEQATGDQVVGPPSDIYALACVLYEMLVGEPPFPGATAQAVRGKIIAGKPVSATEQRPSIPANVDAAIRCALEKLPADRFTSAQDFAKALGETHFRHGEAVADPVGTGKRLTAGLAVTSLLLTLALAWSLTALGDTDAVAPARFEIGLGESGVSGGANTGVDLTISGDGTRIVYRGPGPDGSQLWQRTLDDLEAHPIPGTEGRQAAALNADGTVLAFSGGGAMTTLPLQGGPTGQELPGATNATFGSDGMLFYRVASSGHIWRMPARGGQPEAFTAPIEGVDQRYPDALPDGKGLLLTLNRGNDLELSGIGVVGPEGGRFVNSSPVRWPATRALGTSSTQQPTVPSWPPSST